MQTPIIFLLNKLGNWPCFIVSLIVSGLCIQGFMWRSNKLMFSEENKLLDSRFFYNPTEVQQFFADLENIKTNINIASNGLKLYALTQVTLDLIFPIAYGVLFTALIFILYQENPPQWLLWLPTLAIVADIGENFTLAFLAWTYADSSSPLAWIAYIFTFTKWIMFLSSLLTIIIGIIAMVKRWILNSF
jgi:hypothetical protein